MDAVDPERTAAVLRRVADGDEAAVEELYRLVHADLHAQARGLMRDQGDRDVLQTTALVHEAWLRIAQAGALEAPSRAAFHSVAARAMRSVLVDHARRRVARKRGDGARRVALADVELTARSPGLGLLAIDEALERLGAVDGQLVLVSELRLFAGLEHGEIGEVLGVSARTSERAWRTARAWLQRELDPGG